MSTPFYELLVLLLFSYGIYVFISDSFYLFRLDHYAAHYNRSSHQRHKRKLALWCSGSMLVSGVVVMLTRGALLETSAIIITALLSMCIAGPAVCYLLY